MSGFPQYMKKTVKRAVVVLLVCLLGMNVFGPFPPKAYADAGPDLIVQDITLSPESPAIGDTVTITIAVKNQGNATAAGSYVTCYVDSDILGTEPISALNAGITVTTAFTWQATGGTHTIRAVADATEIITETDESNNASTYTITTVAPDLIIQSITWSPTNPSAGDSVVFSIVIKNQGNIQSRYTNVNFFIDNNSRGTQDVAAINPDASLTKTYTWTMLTGEHTIRAVIDEADNNKESNETNNEMTVILQTGSLDLAFQAVVWAPQNPSKFDTVTCNVTVINYGIGRANTWSLAYYIDDILKPIVAGPSLEAGASTNITFSWQTLQDEHDIRIILDYYSQLIETDENNNEYTVTITTQKPDLVVSDISWLPTNPGAGDDVTFTVKFTNQGSGKAAASRAICYIDNRFVSYIDVSSLNATAEVNTTFTWSATSGTHTVEVIADYDKTLNETNHDNNDTSVTITVVPPDLIIHNISWAPEDVNLDETVTFTVNVMNQGAGRALDFFLVCFMDDALIKSELIPRLDAGASVNKTCQWTVQNGRHTFKAIVNYNNYIIESDKTNNENSIIFAPKLPDLAVTGIIWSPSDMPVGQNVIFTITVENQGLISATPSRIAFYVDGAVAGYVDVGGLEPGSDTLKYFTWAAAEGSHTINIILDSNNQIAEIDEVNNTIVISIPLPDLIVEDITFSPSDISVGDNLTITAFVKNQGNSETEKFEVSLYVDGVKKATKELPSINSGESFSQAFTWVAEVGIHTFKITADISNTVIEVNETNNEKETSYAAAAPDLIIEGMSWVISEQINSNEATFTITVKNIGTGTAGESQVKYSFDSSPPDIKNIGSIAAGETIDFSFIAILSSGQHVAKIIADSGEIITELDETNNQNTISFSTIAPDLVVRTISYSPLDAKIGDTITFTVKCENRGATKATDVRLVLSIDGSVVDYADLPEIDLATTTTIEFTWTVIEGEHEITVFIDSEHTNIESNEQNNTKSRMVSFAATDEPVKTLVNNNATDTSDGGFISSYWWILLLLAALLCVGALVSVLRAAKKR